jgi:hypothetical protein
MSAKRAKENNVPSLQWLLERGEEAVGQILGDLLGRPGVSDGLAKMAKGAAHTKGRVDKNVETLLHLLNLPSRADYQKLLVKIEHLQGSLVNLNMKLDRALNQQHERKPHPRPTKPPEN